MKIYIYEESTENSNLLRACVVTDYILNSLNETAKQYELYIVKNLCMYISYILYDKIKSIPDRSNFENLYKCLNNYKITYDLNDDNCNIINFYSNDKELDKRIELYFHSEILRWIQAQYNTFNLYYEDVYNKYLKQCANFYNNVIQDDYCNKVESYKSEIENFQTNFNKTKNILKGKGINIRDEETQLLERPSCTSKDLKMKSMQVENMDPPTDDKTFTPIGSSLHRKIGAKKKKTNLEEKTDEFLLDTYENENLSLCYHRYSILYHSSQNE
ncbi:PIR Superfamily Protein [Plasmodium ovale wallikeri]|uniref:PIR Superfamily Protein n=1 Tax=Plasmodium ovale wallikeri TaxID=864142 RepID=A0A1A9AJL9_PLAOA|nr:PIR Superfamily Protein [Plasmodium ovale wallikeri]SBT56377.1 PIR Superfamily Protein [Plasmodium ovale wallikeri]